MTDAGWIAMGFLVCACAIFSLLVLHMAWAQGY